MKTLNVCPTIFDSFSQRLDLDQNGPKNLEVNPDKPERIATKAPKHKGKMFIVIKLRVFVPWWSAINCAIWHMHKISTTYDIWRYRRRIR